MNVVWVRVAGLVRRGWAATVVLAVLAGLGAGVAMAATSAGRRSGTAFDRMVEYADPPSFNLTFCPPELTEVDESTLPLCFTYDADPERDVIAGLPEVDAVVAGFFRGLTASRPDNPDSTRPGTAIVVTDDAIPNLDGHQIIVEGQWYDPESDEVVVNEQFRDLTGIGAGEEVTLTFWAPEEMGRPGRDGEIFHGPSVTVQVVGVSRGILDLAAAAGTPGLQGDDARVLGGPGFAEATADAAGFGGLFVRGRTGDASALLDALHEAFPGRVFNATPAVGDEQEPIREAIRYEAQGVLALGILGGLAAAVFAAQAIARQSRREWSDQALLRAIGFTSRQIWLAAALRGVVIGVAAAAVAGVTAVSLSPLGPVGVARLAETDLGIEVDRLVLVVGISAVMVIATAAAWAPVRRRDRPQAASRTRATRRLLAWGWLPPSLANGAAMGRANRSDGSSLPLGTAMAIVALAAGTFAAAAGLTTSLDSLRATPARYGAPWDISFGGAASATDDDVLGLVRDHPGVAAAGRIVGTGVSIGDQLTWVHAFDAFPGIDAQIQPPITSGRAPAAVNEIALGSITMGDLGLSLGDEVEVRTTVAGSAPTRFTVVGTAMINDVYEESPGRGGIVTVEWVDRAAPEVSPDPYIVRLEPDVDADAFRSAISEVFDGTVSPPVPQTAIRNVTRIRGFPFALAAAVGALALAAFAHALVLSVRRQRRQLAVLQALGFTPRQVGETVAGHATTLALVSVGLGLPVGVVLGRWGWRVVADQIGVVNLPVTPLLPLAVTVVTVVASANVVAIFPAWRARRVPLAEALRAE